MLFRSLALLDDVPELVELVVVLVRLIDWVHLWRTRGRRVRAPRLRHRGSREELRDELSAEDVGSPANSLSKFRNDLFSLTNAGVRLVSNPTSSATRTHTEEETLSAVHHQREHSHPEPGKRTFRLPGRRLPAALLFKPSLSSALGYDQATAGWTFRSFPACDTEAFRL